MVVVVVGAVTSGVTSVLGAGSSVVAEGAVSDVVSGTRGTSVPVTSLVRSGVADSVADPVVLGSVADGSVADDSVLEESVV